MPRVCSASVLGVPLLVLALCALTADDYGISWDEKVQRDYGVLASAYYRTMGEDKSCNSYLNLRWYTPVYEALLHLAAQQAAPWQSGPPVHPTPLAAEYTVRHLLNSVVGTSAVLATACFARLVQLSRPSAPPPVIAALLLAATPRFYGHFFANTKDIPFAAAYAWSMVGILCTLDGFRPAPLPAGAAGSDAAIRLPWGMGMATALAVGFTVSLRSAGLLLLPMCAAGLLATISNAYASHERVALPPLPGALLWMVVTVCSLWFGIVALWPAALEAPLTHPVETVLESVHFSTVVRMRFSGGDAWSNALPRRYYFEMFGATLPLPMLVCMCGGLAHAVCTVITRKNAVAQRTVDVPRLLLLMWALIPLLMFFAKPLNVYDGIRHFLFILPPLALLGAEPLGMLLHNGEPMPRAVRWAVVLLISLSAVPSMIALHPYQLSYFSDVVGGLGAVAQEPMAYDTEYWATCYREATEWSVRHAGQGSQPRHILGAANGFSKECIEPFAPPEWTISTLLDAGAPKLPSGVDYYVSTTRWGMHQLYPESTVIHRVERNGATLCLVKSDRSDAQVSAHSSPRAASPGGTPHQLLSEETIRDGNTPPPPPPDQKDTVAAMPLVVTPPVEGVQPDTIAATIAAKVAQAELVARESLANKPLGVPPPPKPKPPVSVDPTTGMQPVNLPPGTVEDTASAMHSYAVGNALRDEGRVEEAIREFTVSINRDNSSPAAYNNLGAMLEARRRVPEALHIYELAVQRHPDFALGFFNLGSRLLLSLPDDPDAAATQLKVAMGHLQSSVDINPEYFAAWSNLGDAKRGLADLDGAVACYLEALSRSPTYEVARNNLGNALKSAGRLDEAAAQYELAVKAAMATHGGYGPAAMWGNLGAVYMEQDKLQDALLAYSNATLADPTYAPAYTNMGRIYEDQGLVDLALKQYKLSFELKPIDALEMSMAFLLPPIMPASAQDRELSLQHIMDYLNTALVDDGGSLGRENFSLQNPVDELGTMAFYLTYYGVNLRPVRERLAALVLKGQPRLSYQAPHCAARLGEEATDRRLEIGIASKSFYDHSTGKWMAGMIQDLDRTKFRVTVIMIPPLREDALSPIIIAAADEVVTPTADVDNVREVVANLALDILVLADVGMDTTLYALAFARLAPVQVGIAAAWPVTTGIPSLDYMASFDVEIAGAQDHYSEKLIRLPGILPYADPVPENLAMELKGLHSNIEELMALRSELGLPPPGTVVYLCIQAP